ncbi:hypothetical protein [Oceanobacillus bengalensis]|uniref:Lipoprotein n=1 Tax=Oceanobacillus bengalensis TaxID=1435466 RepID=A0A494YRB1_9BACI|nr:hypothetical protein [Oceanobacillus bengalensis]RKQ11768.1 hypothetical protein D8M05_19325 [Oceanobacillus bengalensis]
MKKRTKNFYFNVVLLFFVGILTGCANDGNEETTTNSSENNSVLESTEEDTTKTDENASTSEIVESNTDEANDISSEETDKDDSGHTPSENSDSNVGDKEDKETLSQYSSEQIEYARVWLQLGANQDIDGLYVQHIPAGTPLNPNDETSLEYPEDVIQLAGGRLVDGSVTYSGNGDGTINEYNVPLRWDGNYPAGEKFYTDIINHTESVYIDTGNDEDVIELIKLTNIQ